MNKEYYNRITTSPNVCLGKPVIKGTRLTVELILRQMAQGITVDKILKNYPHLTYEDILAVLTYAAHQFATKQNVVYTLKKKKYYE